MIIIKRSLIFIGIICLVVTYFTQPKLVAFWPNSITDIAQLLMPLFLVAAFMERALEVFITAWREGGKSRLAEIELQQYKDETQRMAFIASLVLGIVISTSGIRALELFVDPGSLERLGSIQRSLFTTIDVLLTGALLGGGSEGIHRVINIITNYVDSTANKFKPEKPPGQ